MKLKFIYLVVFVGILIPKIALTQDSLPQNLDSLVQKAMEAFHVPGMSVAIVLQDHSLFCKGYGLRSIETNNPVDDKTLFGIASNSKAFTAAALAILVDEGKLGWEDKLSSYLPNFQMYSPYVTQEFTIRDMLCHRSGLGLGAGDLMHNPDSSDFTIDDIIHALRYLKPATSFRAKYAYDNIFYLVAAELIRKVTGQSWQDFVEQRIMTPIGMVNTRASYYRARTNSNVIDGYKEMAKTLHPIVKPLSESDAGAGGIYASASDMAKWMITLLNEGRYGDSDNRRLLSTDAIREMWTPQVCIPVTKKNVYNTHFNAYGLGWFLSDVKGYENVSHTGQDDGMISMVSLIPDLKLGVCVLSNQEGGGAVRAVVDYIIDHYIGVRGIDRITFWKDKVKQNGVVNDSLKDAVWQVALQYSKVWNKNGNIANSYIGTYRDNWFGHVTITKKGDVLRFESKRSPKLRGAMYPYKKNTFLVRWDDPMVNADAFVNFRLDEKGRANGFLMERATPETSAAFDFQDLQFVREGNKVRTR